MKYPEALETDDISELASCIERWYPTEELRIHDTRTIHFAYWDKSHRSVSPLFLDHIQQAGYRILYTGIATRRICQTKRDRSRFTDQARCGTRVPDADVGQRACHR